MNTKQNYLQKRVEELELSEKIRLEKDKKRQTGVLVGAILLLLGIILQIISHS